MRIFYDVDTQNDFMNKDGALYVPGAEEIKPNLKRLTDYAVKNNIPVLGSVDRHFGTKGYEAREKELQRNNGPFPDHCMDETFGQRKIKETLILAGKFGIPISEQAQYIAHYSDNKVRKLELSRAIAKATERNNFGITEGIYFEKQSPDVFENPAFEDALKALEPYEAVVYGVATDYCVKAAVVGMQERGIQCFVVNDAIRGVDPKTTESALEEMAKAGARFVETRQILGD